MIVVLKPEATEAEIDALVDKLHSRLLQTRVVKGAERAVVAIIGGTQGLDERELQELPGVAECVRVSRPYKLASREGHPKTVVQIGPITIGGPQIAIMAGPCSVENRESLMEAAVAVRDAGATMLRGGAFKPRTSPYAFQGLGEEGLKLLAEARELTGLPVVTEIVSPSHVEMMAKYADLIQIGARNMQNFELLKAVAEADRPVLLKRGLANTIEELLMAAEYILSSGHSGQVILCERGIRTYESATRNTLDLSAIPVLRELTHLPIVVDPSHGTGHRNYVLPMAMAAIAAGADGILVEVHPNPPAAWSDGPQSLYPRQLVELIRNLEVIAPVVGRQIYRMERTRRLQPGSNGGRTAATATVKVAYQGQPGAFSERATRHFFGTRGEPQVRHSFRDVFEAVTRGDVDYGVLPIENSLTGSIHANYDLLLEYPLHVVGEIKLRIVHSLIAWPGTRLDDIKTVYAHPQAAAQCDEFLQSHPHWQVVNVYDTAGSVDHVRQHELKDGAAIASAEAAGLYGMTVIQEGIETHPGNFTRFIVVSKVPDSLEEADKTSIVFSTRNEPGALFGVLKSIAEKQLNMVKLESRPIPGKPWEYMFYVDLQGSQPALEEVQSQTPYFRVLGSYRSAP